MNLHRNKDGRVYIPAIDDSQRVRRVSRAALDAHGHRERQKEDSRRIVQFCGVVMLVCVVLVVLEKLFIHHH